MIFSKAISRDAVFSNDRPVTVTGVPAGMEAWLLAALAAEPSDARYRPVVLVMSDGTAMDGVAKNLEFVAPGIKVHMLPAWDCLPYDRVSPGADVTARRLATLSALAQATQANEASVVLTSANALVQRVPPRAAVVERIMRLVGGAITDMDHTVRWLSDNGYERASTVRDHGEYAVRGGIIDLYPPATRDPIRLDFFGDQLESIRSFDTSSQRTLAQLGEVILLPMSELFLDQAAVRRFRTGFVNSFGAADREDSLYRAISEGRRHAGMEHWLPLFFEHLETQFDYFSDCDLVFDHNAGDAVTARLNLVGEHYQARLEQDSSQTRQDAPYRAVEPKTAYLEQAEIDTRMGQIAVITPFDVPPTAARATIELNAGSGREFSAERTSGQNVFEALSGHIGTAIESGRRVAIACWSEGSRTRLAQVLAEHGADRTAEVGDFSAIETLPDDMVALAILPLDRGFETEHIAFIAEQDVLGDRLVRRTRKKRAGEFLSEVASLAEGDIVVHIEHGIARFAGLKTLEVTGAPHDCLELRYLGDDRLYLPIENIELLSRYGSAGTEVMLDKLGGVAWQARKAKLKKSILEMAGQLIELAATRALKRVEPMHQPEGLFDEFASRFPYDETEDQLSAINAVLDDLVAGTPMDRLICGDVGFGKTEVALRAAFVSVMSGRQVAVVVPTTLLARQHFKTFNDRFSGLPVRIGHASRLVSAKDLAVTRSGMADGTLDIVIGTHALLAKSVSFDRLGLLVIDEEQRFGVKHKEKLKELRSDVHVLTLSATPIPRTLQLALTGVRELSLITTAPVDRMAVRTFVSPFDTLTIREALLREHYRGGQSFYVCPRISDIEEQRVFLRDQVPELRVAVAHGQMPPTELDDVMNAYYDGRYDVLLSTSIVESGLDIPTANTLIVYRADMFGLAQLYQLRGRVGRSKTRAYALFVLARNKTLTKQAERRLHVLQSLDSIGAGFQLASHDLDIRGSGNLLGDEQSGHIKEVGYELYQQMLEEAVAELKDGGHQGEEKWSPQITVGTSVMIPETYVGDLQLRMSLYRRMSDLTELAEIDAFASELIDRFGALPEEVDHLLKIVYIKGLCRGANIAKLEAGPKGLVISFRNQIFANPGDLVGWIGEQGSLAKIRPDQSIVLSRDWPDAERRLKGAAVIAKKLADMAGQV